MSRLIIASVLCAALLLSGSAAAQTAASLVCPILKKAPEIDGAVADDPAWAGVAETPIARLLGDGRPARESRFKVAYTADAFYAAVICDEPEPDKITAQREDGGNVWEEDSVEVFLSPDGKTELQFAVNAIGSRYSPLTLKRWRAAAQVEEGRWCAEIEIPWEVIGVAPKAGQAWRLNVCRNRLTSGAMEHCSWAPVGASFHEVENFGKVTFDGLDPDTQSKIAARIKDNPITDDVFLVSREALGIQRVTERGTDRALWAQGSHVAPRFSPDGKFIAYTSTLGGKAGVWIAASDGSGQRRVCDGCQPAWSPDGACLVFQRDGRIIERSLSSGKEKTLTRQSKLSFAWPSYLRDEAVICLETKTGSIVKLYRQEGKDGEVLVKGGCYDRPMCSPDGSMIAYRRGAHIFVMDAQSGISNRLTLAPGFQSDPVWSMRGDGICYCQAPDRYSETWDAHYVSLKNPADVYVVERGMHKRFEWRGAAPSALEIRKATGVNLTLWNNNDGADLADASELDSKKGWKQIPAGMPSCVLNGSVAAQNDWLILHASPAGIKVIVKNESGKQFQAPLRVTDIGGDAFAEVQEIRLLAIEPDAISLSILCGSGKSGMAQVDISLPRTSPAVEIRPESPKTLISIPISLALAVAPDRFANDLVLEATGGGPERIVLPTVPLLVGFVEEPPGIVAVATPAPEQFIGLVRAEDGRRFEEVAVAPTGESFFLTFNFGEKLWSRHEISKADDGSRGVKWRCPLRGQWRMTIWNADRASSRMWNGQDIDERMVHSFRDVDPAEGQVHRQVLQGMASGTPLFTLDWEAEAEPLSAIAYIWAREGNTPFDVLTVEDALIDAMGLERYWKVMDIDGIRRYRCGEGWLPFRDLETRELEWAPWESHLETRGFGILDIMSGVFPAGTPGVKAFITNMGNDAIRLLEGLDARIAEYDVAIDAMRSFCVINDDDEFLRSVAQRAVAVLKAGRDAERDDVERIRNALGALMEVSRPTERRLWDEDIIYKREEFREFSRTCRTLMAQRRKVLAEYRSFAKQVRDEAGRRALADPACRQNADTLREAARMMLRNRYYLEPGWNGELPVESEVEK